MGKKEITRKFIIEKAAPLLNKKGVAGTSMSDIMQATKLAKGGIYGNFKDGKKELVAEAFDYMADKLYQSVKSSVIQHESAADRLFALLAYYESYVLNPVVEGGCPILNFAVEADDTNPDLKEKVARLAQRVQNAVGRIVQKGIDDGDFRDNVDPGDFGLQFMIIIEGAIMLSKLQNTNKPMLKAASLLKNEVKRMSR